MDALAGFTAMDWLVLVEHELLLFAGVFFLIGAIDEFAMDLTWLWLKATGRAKTGHLQAGELEGEALSAPAAILIPTWDEADVIAMTVSHALNNWPQAELRLYVGCYANDRATAEAIIRGIGPDTRARLVVHDATGPTTKADCLNRLYQAMRDDELRTGREFGMVVLHDAEDMVDPAALPLLDRAVREHDFIQLPVLPVPDPESRWVSAHYCEEFAESHGKAMVVRDALSAAIPAAGVGCAMSRAAIGRLAQTAEVPGQPFSVESLTEDYEMGLRLRRIGSSARFLRVRSGDGRLVATRSYFPSTLTAAVRQKTRWVHGIAFQGWDRTGWEGSPAEWWMRIRDRRGPLAALTLAAAYILLILATLLFIVGLTGHERPWLDDPVIGFLLVANMLSLGWRIAMRFAFTTHEYGWREGLRAILRLPLANIIAIMAGRRALFAYIGTLAGQAIRWDKTSHQIHPVSQAARAAS